jgi:ABC-type multidrug transport system ATPase subunit
MPPPSASAPVQIAEPRAGASAFEVITVQDLSKRFGELWALRDANFSIRRGEILGLIGPNGSGKTTLFQCLAGLAPATRGTVERDATRVAPDDRKNLLYFVPDGVRPWADQTVAWTLRFTAGVHEVSREEVDAVSFSLGLEPLAGARLRELSKGEHRRVVLAIGLLTPHPLLMLDEPFDGLDLRQTRDVMAVLRAHAKRRTLFLSIHQLPDAERVCDRFVLLSAGRVAGEGTLDELRTRAGIASSEHGGGGGLEEVFLALT